MKRTGGKCSIDKCQSVVKSRGYCARHYMKLYRHGDPLFKVEARQLVHSSGYILVPSHSHPVAGGRSHAYQHRVVFYDAHGTGPFDCHWCGKVVTLADLHVDHLDDVKSHNKINNLVPSCSKCNQQRGAWKGRQKWRDRSGLTAFGETRTPNEWAREFGISRQSILARLKNGWSAENAVSIPRGVHGPQGSSL